MKKNIRPSNTESAEDVLADPRRRIQENGDFFMAIIDQFSAMVAYWTRDYRCLFANRAYAEWFGKTEQEIFLIKIEDLLGEQLFQLQSTRIEGVLSGIPQQFEQVIKSKDGRTKTVKGEYLPDIRDGETQGFYSLIYDITSLKAAEKNVIGKSEEMSAVLGRITDGFISLDKNDVCTFVNKQAAEMLNANQQELPGHQIWEYFPALKNQKVFEAIRRCQETALYQRCVDYFPLKMTWNEFRVFPSESGVSIFVRDVTVQKEEENRLRLLESIIKHTGDAIVIMSDVRQRGEEAMILYVNEAFEQLTGYSGEEIIGKGPSLLHGPKTDLVQLERLQEAAFNKETVKTVLVNYAKSGKPYWVEFSLSPVVNAQQECTHWIAIQRDVTERILQDERNTLRNSISKAFTQQGGLPNILSQSLEKFRKYGNFLLAEIWLRSFDNQALTISGYYADEVVAGKFYSKDSISRILLQGDGFIRGVWGSGMQASLLDVDKNDFFLRKEAAISVGLKAVYGFPLIDSNDAVQGVMMIGMKDNESDYQFLNLVERVIDHLTAEIVRKKLELDLAQIFRQAPDIIAIAGTDGYFKKVNPAMSLLLGYTEQDLLERNMISFIHPDDVDSTLEAFSGAAEGKPLEYFENRLLTRAGDSIWLAWTVSSATENGLIFCVAKDTTERKHSEQELISLNKKLEGQNAQLRDISWVQSHMVRAPLANILGLLDLLDYEDAHLSDETKSTLLMIKKSACELDNVIAKITDLSKVS